MENSAVEDGPFYAANMVGNPRRARGGRRLGPERSPVRTREEET